MDHMINLILKKSHVFGASVTKVLKNENGIVNVCGVMEREKRFIVY